MMFMILLTTLITSSPAHAESAVESICTKFYNVRDQQQCAVELQNKNFAVEAISTCTKFYDLNDQQKCLVSLSDLKFKDKNSVKICKQYYDLKDQKNCLKQIGSPDPYIDNSAIEERMERLKSCQSFQTPEERIYCMQIIERMLADTSRLDFSQNDSNVFSSNVSRLKSPSTNQLGMNQQQESESAK